MVSGFDVFANQPALAALERFILMDIGTHLLDVARVLFGEAHAVSCLTSRTLPHVAGDNVATVLLSMGGARTHVIVELGYAGTPLDAAHEVFPQTLALVEGSRGSIELAGGYSAAGHHAPRDARDAPSPAPLRLGRPAGTRSPRRASSRARPIC